MSETQTQNVSLPLTWTALEFNQNTRQSSILFGIIGVLVAVIIYALITNNPVMAITFVLLATVTFLQGRKRPKTLSCAITVEGVTVGDEQYVFENIRSFWVFYEPEEQSLFLKTNGALIASVRVPLGNMSPTIIREAILPFAREEKYEPTLIDTLSTFLHI